MVWAVCMLFFQGLLLLGYLYTHLSQKWIGVYRYSRWHLLLLTVPFIAFPFRFESLSAFASITHPALAVIYLLAINCALVFFALSTISLILQSWLHINNLPQKKNPYVLYSASNLGAILALLTYPTLFEPLFNLNQQGYIWWSGYLVLFGLCALCLPGKAHDEETWGNETNTATTKAKEAIQWFLLSVAGCFTLLSITNLLTFDIVVVPFLWCLPLSVYLLTFVLVFKRIAWYPDWTKKAFGWAVSLGIMQYLMSLFRLGLPILLALILELGILFIVCLNCHGKLVQLKPWQKNKLTLFYFILAAGGFTGSLLVGIVIPLITKSLLEYPASFFIAYLALIFPLKKETKPKGSFLLWILKTSLLLGCVAFILVGLPLILTQSMQLPLKKIMICVTFLIFIVLRLTSNQAARITLVLLCVLIFSQWTEEISLNLNKTFKLRNFYGINFVYDRDGQRFLQHGTTMHGRQYLSGPKTLIPLAYFHPSTPAWKLLTKKAARFNESAMIGLCTGALSVYLKHGQRLTIYELDPDIIKIAHRFFGYLKQAQEKGVILDYVLGDGRISLGKTKASAYDLLILDVFNSDSIPPHLLTVEAIREYKRVLKPNGILLMHISNRIFDLRPIIYSAGEKEGLFVFENTNGENIASQDADVCTWMVLCLNPQAIKDVLQKDGWKSAQEAHPKIIKPWTDQYVNLLGVLKRPFLPQEE